MPSWSTIIATLVVSAALFAAYTYVFGVSPEIKRKLEEKALETMGENKASYIVKDSINKIPSSDQPEIQDLKKSLGDAVGALAQNPIGKTTGGTVDDATKDITGR